MGPSAKASVAKRLSRIEGQVRGIRGMLEKDAYCVDILVQVAAANSALNSFSKELLAQHVRTCVADDLRAGDSFLLCSDGLWAYFGEAELGGVLAAHTARAASELLIDRARTRAQGEGDNVSLAILKLVEAPSKNG